MESKAIESLLDERRAFPPPPAFAAQANAGPGIYAEAEGDPLAFWAGWARKLHWSRPFTRVLDWEEPFAQWFADGAINASVNCLDRHVEAGLGARIAYYYEGEPGDRRAITYRALLEEVCRFANALRRLGIERGDRVAIYMPMIPELPVAMLACARIGAAHSVIFGGFSPDAIIDRVNDAECVALITADQGWRRGNKVPLKANCDVAMAQTPSIRHCIVAKRVGDPVTMMPDRDLWWDDLVARESTTCEPAQTMAEDLLFLLYTSGTTAKPKGIKHTTGGYLTHVSATHQLVFDLKAERDIYWCAADIGWVTGHSYIVYGPLCNAATSVIYEGTPDYPEKDRLWEIVERYGVTILYTAPTAIRTFMKWGTQHLERHDLSSLRLLGSVGEPINPEAWIWYREHVGGGRCPIVDTWWQTETGGMMISPLPGVTTALPGSATKPLPGISADIVDEAGKSVPLGGGGYIVITQPWPGMTRGIYGDDERFRETYWSKFPHLYLAGDGCHRDDRGNYWFMGRIDDVMNVSGHRISTAEVESAFVDHPAVAEAAVCAKNDDVTGQAIYAFVTLRGGFDGTPMLADALRDHVMGKLGKFTRPKYVTFTPELPKTRSGKIMRRLLRDIAEGRTLGDTTTLADSGVVSELQQRAATDAAKEE
ncbi:MAG: acetate--CoA ligase [Candidatus Eremiobacteraeota bacterium]|uniref:acetate--CoA ligase n=1 Tax=mine drainage metagenome TaxID=410659 RepID=E6PIN6_9ZZZZ|nr:acetate--CoA ligase [Candidatus Eremiobacteraeota bacterium]